jgi:hypothetical protein
MVIGHSIKVATRNFDFLPSGSLLNSQPPDYRFRGGAKVE